MKAIYYTQYGSVEVLKYQDVEKPVPKKNEVLVKVISSSLNSADWRVMRGTPFLTKLMTGLSKPKYNIIGSDISGVIESIGDDCSKFKIGDEVYGDLSECTGFE